MISEEWKPVIGYEGRYEVSNTGGVRSLKNGVKSLFCVTASNGYQTVTLYRGGRASKKRFYVHSLVLQAFVGPRPFEDWHACHNNGVKHDNRLENLRWDTPSANQQDKKLHGTEFKVQGSKHGQSKLTESQILEIRARLASGEKVVHLAKEYAVSHALISLTKSRKRWTHI